MTQDLYQAEYDITKKSKIKKFYESNKIFIYSLCFIFIVLIGSFIFYFEAKKSKRISVSEDYIMSKVYLEEGNKVEATNLLKKVIFENDSTYSPLSLFLIKNQNLITDYKELSSLFDHIIKNNKFADEITNLLIYKKALLTSDYKNESELLKDLKLLLNSSSLWRPHALLLLGDYFVQKKEYLKAREFYLQILSIKDLHIDFYDQARTQISLISNE